MTDNASTEHNSAALSLNVQPAQAPQPARSSVSRASRGLQDLQAPAPRLQV